MGFVMVEKGGKIVCNDADPSACEPGRAAISRSVGEQVPHAETTLHGGIGVPVEPASWGSLQPDDRDPVRFAPPAPGEASAVARLHLAVFVPDRVFGHGHG